MSGDPSWWTSRASSNSGVPRGRLGMVGVEIPLPERVVAPGHSPCHALRRGPPLQGRVPAPER
eukprot:106779-Heterocapsa_arctica.AAC.1